MMDEWIIKKILSLFARFILKIWNDEIQDIKDINLMYDIVDGDFSSFEPGKEGEGE